jgi:hypothetical protein
MFSTNAVNVPVPRTTFVPEGAWPIARAHPSAARSATGIKREINRSMFFTSPINEQSRFRLARY